MCSSAFQEAVHILEEARQRRRWVGKFWSFWFQNIMTAKTLIQHRYFFRVVRLQECWTTNWYCSGWSESRSRKWERWSTDREELIKFVASIHFCFCPFYPTCCKVLLVGLYKDQGSPLKMLRSPRMVVQDVMPIIWQKITYNWQVFCLIRHAKTTTLCSYICANFLGSVLSLGIFTLILGILKLICAIFPWQKNALVL